MASITFRNGHSNGTVWNDVRLSEAAPTVVDATPVGATEGVSGITSGQAQRIAHLIDISSFIPSGSTINSATFFQTRSAVGLESHPCEIFRLSSVGWSEASNTLTWNTQATAGAAITKTYLTGTAAQSVDITALVQDAITSRSGILAFLVKEVLEAEALIENLPFHSANAVQANNDIAGIRPYIDVNYTEPAPGGVGGVSAVSRHARVSRVSRK